MARSFRESSEVLHVQSPGAIGCGVGKGKCGEWRKQDKRSVRQNLASKGAHKPIR